MSNIETKRITTQVVSLVIFVALYSTGNAQIPTNGLVASYTFSGNANDESGNGRHAIPKNTTSVADRFSRPDMAYSFNGTSSWINLPPMNLPYDLTVSVWVKTDQTGTGGWVGNPHIIGKDICGGALDWDIGLMDVNKVSFTTYDATLISPVVVSNNQWNHIVVVRESGTKRIYINGTLSITGTMSTAAFDNANDSTAVGVHGCNTNRVGWFRGIIDDVRFYNRALGASEITDLFNETVGPPIPPQAPTDLKAILLCSTRIQLMWMDNSTNETRFVVERRMGVGSWIPMDTVSANIAEIELENIQPSSQYSFQVKAINYYGSSTYSNIAQVSTGVFNAPSDLTGRSNTTREIVLHWLDNSDCEAGFIIERMIAPSVWNPIDTVSEGIIETTIDNLQAGTQYDFRVKAYYGTIQSAYSNTVTVRTRKFLPAPTEFQVSVISAVQAQLSWVDNATEETGYEVEQRSSGGSWSLVSTTPADATTFTRSGLTPDSTYYFRVRAVGDDASSDWSNERMVVMVFRPDAPIALLARAVDYKSIHLQWTRGSWNETLYEIERREGVGSWIPVKTTGRGDTATMDDGLNDTTIYTYHVRAVNSAGVSDWSNEASATTGALPIPNAPFALTANTTSSVSIRLTWLTSEPSVEAGFEIEESLTGNGMDFTRIMPDAQGSAHTYDRVSLKPQTTYWYRIRAFNKSGYSAYSKIVNATTFEGTKDPPLAPFNLTAEGRSLSEIRLTWAMPDSAFVENFVLERSLTGGQSDFRPVTPDPSAVDRVRIDTGLATNSMYYYRIKAVNRYGSSDWSNTASAKTRDLVVTPALLTAMNAKDTLIGVLESLIPHGNADIVALRKLFGDYPRGYDESAAKTLIQDLHQTGSTEPTKTTDAMRRYTLAERALLDAYATDVNFPGAKEMAREIMLASSLCAKDFGALILLWKDERAKIPTSWLSRYDAVMDDLSFSMFDGERTLASLIGMSSGCASIYAEAVNNNGDIPTFASRQLLMMTSLFQERFLGRVYFPATQFVIDDYAQHVRNPIAIGSYDSAFTKVMRHIDVVKTQTLALKSGFTQYGNSLTDLDAASVISSSGNVDIGPFLRKMTVLRPRLLDNSRKAIVGSWIPITRAAYMTSSADIPGIGSLPFEIRSSANVAFDPVKNTIKGESNIFRSLSKSMNSMRSMDQALIDADRSALLTLRAKVLEKDTTYIGMKFNELRSSGRNAITELGKGIRPIDGITPASFLSDTLLMYACLDAVAKTHRARALRTVLSTALADYLTDAAETKNAPLVAEIDTILWYYDLATNALAGVMPNISSIITEPVLSVENALLVRVNQSNHRVMFTVKNVGGNDARATRARLTLLTSGVIATTADTFSLGTLAKGEIHSDSIDIRIPQETTSIAIAAAMTVAGNRIFNDYITLAVPTSTQTGIRDEESFPSVVMLYQNYPNPFSSSDRSSTTITYSLKEESPVVLKVFNALGMELGILVNETKSAGVHTVTFNARSLESGVYTYTLLVNGQMLSRQMILLK